MFLKITSFSYKKISCLKKTNKRTKQNKTKKIKREPNWRMAGWLARMIRAKETKEYSSTFKSCCEKNFSLENIPNIFLEFRKCQPQYAYKVYSYKVLILPALTTELTKDHLEAKAYII